jgi:predicted  nucleic acid-binding Zn-ribbon protein
LKTSLSNFRDDLNALLVKKKELSKQIDIIDTEIIGVKEKIRHIEDKLRAKNFGD